MTVALAALFDAETPVAITEEWKELVDGLDLDPDLKVRLLDPDLLDDALDDLAVDDPGLARYFHAVTHLTVSPNVLHAGIKANMIPDQAEAEVDVRTLPGMDRDDGRPGVAQTHGRTRPTVSIWCR